MARWMSFCGCSPEANGGEAGHRPAGSRGTRPWQGARGRRPGRGASRRGGGHGRRRGALRELEAKVNGGEEAMNMRNALALAGRSLQAARMEPCGDGAARCAGDDGDRARGLLRAWVGRETSPLWRREQGRREGRERASLRGRWGSRALREGEMGSREGSVRACVQRYWRW